MDSDVDMMPLPFQVTVKKVNDVKDQFVCVHPQIDEATQCEPQLPTLKHLRTFDNGIIKTPSALCTQNTPTIEATFDRV